MKYFAVIDTNVLVSAMLKKNTPPDKVIRQALEGDIIPLMSQEIMDEYREVLNRAKFKFPENSVKVLITGIVSRALFVDTVSLEEVLPDSKDTVFYEVVMEGRKFADSYLITGNLKHFPQRSFIVDPREMLNIMEKSEKEKQGGEIMLKKVSTTKAPAAIGPYSQGIVANGFLFASGQIPIVPQSEEIAEGDITVQAHQVMKNIGEVLKEAGCDFESVVKTTCFLADMADFAAFNSVYEEYFTGRPARSCVAVKELPKKVLCEVEVIAAVNS